MSQDDTKIEEKKSSKSLYIIIGLIIVILGGYYYSNVIYPNQKLKEEISNINKQLPIMVDEGTRLDSATFEKNQLTYGYTFLNVDILEVEADKFATELANRLKINVCKNENTKVLLNSGKTIKYTYKDKNNSDVASVSLTVADCPKQ